MNKPENTPKQATARRKNGTFAKGHTGNAGGRPGNLANLRAKLAAGSDEIATVVLDAAKAGDLQACRLVLERIVPSLKPIAEPVAFDLDDTDLPSTARSILRAIANGTLPSDQGKALLDAVLGMARVVEVAELEQQLIELRGLVEADR
ncbi:hypothetical protein ACYZTL_26685 [Pseudomonas sp. LB3P81]